MKKILISALLLTALCGLFAQGLCINEVQSKNGSTITDPEGDYCDWVEIHNAGNIEIDLGGMYLADDHYEGSLDDAYMISDEHPDETTLEPGGYMLFWFDEDIDDGIFHVNTKLGGDADAVYLISAENEVIDSFVYEYDADTGLDVDDVSIGRSPDGTDNWIFYGVGYDLACTPGAENEVVANNPNTVPEIEAVTLNNYPNPFNPETTVCFTVPQQTNAELVVFNIRGQKVKTLFHGNAEQGENNVVWNGTDESGKNVSSGIYYCRLTTSNQTSIRKMVLMQ